MILFPKKEMGSLIYHTKGNAKTFKVETSFGTSKFTKPYVQSEDRKISLGIKECIKKSPGPKRGPIYMAGQPALDSKRLDRGYGTKREHHNITCKIRWSGIPNSLYVSSHLRSKTDETRTDASKKAEMQQKKEDAVAAEKRFQKMKEKIDTKHKSGSEGGGKDEHIRGPSV